MRLSLAFIFIFTFSFSFAQDYNSYKSLECEGPIPDPFIIPSIIKYKNEVAKINTEGTDIQRLKDQDEFALQINFALDDILQSGMVLFNDPISDYLQEVMEELHSTSGGGVEIPKVYVVRTYNVNAFATDRGSVFVTMGLLSQLENEAQLAYILAHELVHFEKRHSRELFLEALDIEREIDGNQTLREGSVDDILVSKNYYSKELENEADKLGLDKILKTNYSLSTLNTVYDVLKYAYLPYDEVVFEPSYFESAGYQFPEKFWLEEVKSIEGFDEEEDDSKSTHPNIASRRAALQERIDSISEEGRKNFIVSQERFEEAQNLSRLELPYLYLYDDALPEAIYTTHALLKQFPDNNYLEKAMAKALYAFAAYKNESEYGYSIQYSEVEGELQRCYYFLKKLNKKESTILALRYMYQLREKMPEDIEVEAMLADLFEWFANYFKTLSKFENEVPDIDTTTTVEIAQDTVLEEERSKFDKIRETKKEEFQPGQKDYWKFAFIGLLGDEDFLAGFDRGQENHKEATELSAYYISREGNADYRAYLRRIKKHGLRLGIKKIGIVQPLYYKLNNRYESKPLYLESDIGKATLREWFVSFSEELDLEMEVLDPELLKNDDAQVFNDFRFLNDWVSQQLMQEDVPPLVGYDQIRINEIADRYETDYFLWPGVIGLDQGKGVLVYAVLFDIRTGKREMIKFDLYRQRFKEKFLKGHIYDVLAQIRAEEK